MGGRGWVLGALAMLAACGGGEAAVSTQDVPASMTTVTAAPTTTDEQRPTEVSRQSGAAPVGACPPERLGEDVDVGPIEGIWTEGIESIVVVEPFIGVAWPDLRAARYADGLTYATGTEDLTGDAAIEALEADDGFVRHVEVDLAGRVLADAIVEILGEELEPFSVNPEWFTDPGLDDFGPARIIFDVRGGGGGTYVGPRAAGAALVDADGAVAWLGECGHEYMTLPFERYLAENGIDRTVGGEFLLRELELTISGTRPPPPTTTTMDPVVAWEATPPEERGIRNAPPGVVSDLFPVGVQVALDEDADLDDLVLCAFEPGVGWSDCVDPDAFGGLGPGVYSPPMTGTGVMELWLVRDDSQIVPERVGTPAVVAPPAEPIGVSFGEPYFVAVRVTAEGVEQAG